MTPATSNARLHLWANVTVAGIHNGQVDAALIQPKECPLIEPTRLHGCGHNVHREYTASVQPLLLLLLVVVVARDSLAREDGNGNDGCVRPGSDVHPVAHSISPLSLEKWSYLFAAPNHVFFVIFA
ncbi:unnamed protein product [Lampetra planeri]